MDHGFSGEFLRQDGDDNNDHPDVWQDGALIMNLGTPEWVGYFAAFNQQLVPTDDLGNPVPNGKPIQVL